MKRVGALRLGPLGSGAPSAVRWAASGRGRVWEPSALAAFGRSPTLCRFVSLLTFGVREAELADHVLELTVHLAPFAHPNERQEALATDAPQVRAASLLGLADERPEPQEPHEVGVLVPEPPVKVVGLLLRLARALARVLDVEGRGDHQHVAEAALLGPREDHPADARVDRETGEARAERGELAARPERAQLLEHAVPFRDRLGVRRIEEWEVFHVSELERLHPEDDARQPGSLDSSGSVNAGRAAKLASS